MEAEKVLKNISDTHPENIRARMMLGGLYLSLQRIEYAARWKIGKT